MNDTEKGNDAIATFMKVMRKSHQYKLPEFERYRYNPMAEIGDAPYLDDYFNVDELRYHKSWRWLMPVIEAIEKVGESGERFGTLCDICTTHVRIGNVVIDNKPIQRTKIATTWEAVVHWIMGYNLVMGEAFTKDELQMIDDAMSEGNAASLPDATVKAIRIVLDKIDKMKKK